MHGGAWLFICQSHMHTLLYSSVQLTDYQMAKNSVVKTLNSSVQLLYTYIIPLLQRLHVCIYYIYMAVYPVNYSTADVAGADHTTEAHKANNLWQMYL